MRNETKKVLIMEDDEKILATLCAFFSQQNFEVLQAENGEIGYKLAVKFIPDIIISDIFMPEMDGYEVLIKLKENPLTESIPFIYLSSVSGPSAERLSKELGANYHLIKPFVPDLILPLVNQLLKKKTDYNTIH